MRFLNLAKLGCFGLMMMIAVSCKRKVHKLKSPPHYNFATNAPYKLDLKLKEISGIVWDPVKDIFYAITDEKGILYVMNKDPQMKAEEHPFGDNGDYEDITLIDGVPYVLRSDGHITKILKDNTGKMYGVEVGKFSLSGKNDFETMYYDPARKALIAICKNCELDDKKTTSAFAFYPDSTGFDPKPIYTIDQERINKLSEFKNSKFQPSAAAIHPVFNKLFILSSASHQLAITDLNGNVEAVYQLSKKLFNQPEGITFKQNGNMYISNEGGGAKPTILLFTYTDNTSETKEQIAKIGYDFSKPDDKMELAEKLHEISGMSYIPGKEMLVAHNDEKGEIFLVDFKNKSNDFQKLKFAGKSDYEDIVHTDTAEYLLISTGGIIKVHTADSSLIPKEFNLGIEGENEFETLYKDIDGSLILLCKQCDHEKDKIRAAYRFDPKTDTFSKEPLFEIDITEIQRRLNDETAEFKPSAAAIQPVTGKLFVIASVGKLLVILDKGKLDEVIRLDPLMYNQPEGMTFAPNGDLYISNEGGEGVAKIYKFVYKKK